MYKLNKLGGNHNIITIYVGSAGVELYEIITDIGCVVTE